MSNASYVRTVKPDKADKAEILDACCGGRMWWWDKAHPLAVYADVREAPRGSKGLGTRWLIFYKPLDAAALEAAA